MVKISRITVIGRKYIHLENGNFFDKYTGIQQRCSGLRIWLPLQGSHVKDVKLIKEANEARRWFARILDNNEVAVDIYRNVKNANNLDCRKPFNYLTDKERDSIKNETIGFIRANYRRPDWCGHPYPFNGCFGCEKMLMGKKIKKSECFLKCRFYVPVIRHEIYHRLRMLASLSVAQLNSFLSIIDYQSIETGERDPTVREITLLDYLYGMKDWTLEQVQFFIQSKATERKDDPFLNEYGNMIKKKLNYEKKKNIKL